MIIGQKSKETFVVVFCYPGRVDRIVTKPSDRIKARADAFDMQKHYDRNAPAIVAKGEYVVREVR